MCYYKVLVGFIFTRECCGLKNNVHLFSYWIHTVLVAKCLKMKNPFGTKCFKSVKSLQFVIFS